MYGCETGQFVIFMIYYAVCSFFVVIVLRSEDVRQHCYLLTVLLKYTRVSYTTKQHFKGWAQRLILLALAGSVGITLLIIACALPVFNSNWWPIILVLFYIFSLIPSLLSRRAQSQFYSSGNNPCQDVSIFATTGLVISAFALPLVLAHAGTIA